jgi:hypothetical protein
VPTPSRPNCALLRGWRWSGWSGWRNFRPHLSAPSGAAPPPGSALLHLDLYCDDPKAPRSRSQPGLDYDVGSRPPAASEPVSVLTVAEPLRRAGRGGHAAPDVHDLDDLRGALKPDARGRSWRGDLAALRACMADAAGTEAAQALSWAPPGPPRPPVAGRWPGGAGRQAGAGDPLAAALGRPSFPERPTAASCWPGQRCAASRWC